MVIDQDFGHIMRGSVTATETYCPVQSDVQVLSKVPTLCDSVEGYTGTMWFTFPRV